jgi:hypothetical protein
VSTSAQRTHQTTKVLHGWQSDFEGDGFWKGFRVVGKARESSKPHAITVAIAKALGIAPEAEA